ncbi:MAG TPA: type IV pilin protein [Burkholderiaceae bacterium]|jgi:type IV pilus assembly protein PilE|nr:type IV pilin protein [Burkholderiaceae bacterium]HYJ96740.1 type IV pilin protein [Burkholderiaceae bacterium]
MNRPSKQRGSTLVDICAACLMGSVTMALALPSYQNHLERTQRVDAVSALQRVQQAQLQHHADHGTFAIRLAQLGSAGTAQSDRGLYRITMFSDGPDSFEARATALPDRDQAKDPSCTQLTLRVTNGLVSYEPSARCWNP